MTTKLTWADWWAVFINLPDEQRYRIWNENFVSLDEWKNFIRNKADDIQVEILEYAPRELIGSVADCLLFKARKKLLPKVSTWTKYHPS